MKNDATQTIEVLLDSLKAERRSSPAGMHWYQFWEFLRSKKVPTSIDPPVPLILAASGASDRTKQERLRAQLEWAHMAGILELSIAELRAIPLNHWNQGSLERWDQDNYF
jgi:hypothetical protein